MSGLEKISDEMYVSKLKLAMTDTGVSVLKGAFTTFLGVLALTFSVSAAFRIFFQLACGIFFISITHGMLLVPALLGEFKFIYKGINHSNNDDNDNSQTKTIVEEEDEEIRLVPY